MALELNKVLDAARNCGEVKQTGTNQWLTRCPAHNDQNPSLSIGFNDGKVLINCFAGCTFESVLEAYGLSTNGSKPIKKRETVLKQIDERRIAREKIAKEVEETAKVGNHIVEIEYPYRDEMGKILYSKIKKEYRWSCALEGITRIPYNLDKLWVQAQAGPQELHIAIHEGEKCADLWEEHFGYLAIGMSFGTKDSNIHPEILGTYQVIAETVPTHFYIFPDADAITTGFKWADELIKNVNPKSVKVVLLPGLQGKDDIEQWINRGGTEDEMARLMDEAKPYTHGWKLHAVDDDVIYRPEFLIGKHIIKGHSHIFYGSYGSFKTKLLEDLAICAAGNENWLEAGEGEEDVKPITIDKPMKVLYMDFDNGLEEIGGELAACSRGHGKPAGVRDNLRYVSMPRNPTFKAIENEAIDYLKNILLQEHFDLLVVDNTRRASGAKDENSSEMADAIGNLHNLGHQTGVAVLMAMNTGKTEGRSVRGNSGMLDNVDCIFKCTRESGVDKMLVECDKFRGKKPDSFCVAFMYEPLEDDESILKTFKMVSIEPTKIEKVGGKGDATRSDSHTNALNWLLNEGGVMSIIGKTAREAREYGATQCDAGQNSVGDAIRTLQNEQVLGVDENGKLAIGAKPTTDVSSAALKIRMSELKAAKKAGKKLQVIK